MATKKTSSAPCEACKGKGFLLCTIESGALEIQRCDACEKYASDEEARKSASAGSCDANKTSPAGCNCDDAQTRNHEHCSACDTVLDNHDPPGQRCRTCANISPSTVGNNQTSPATREYCVWADCNRRVYQHVEATSPEDACRVAEDHPEDWQFCCEYERNGYRVSNEVEDVTAKQTFTVGAIRHCKTCSSEIVETVNDSNFSDGECGPCEYQRYRAHAQALDAARGLYDLIDELREGGCNLFDDDRPLLDHCLDVLHRQDQCFREIQ